MASLLDRLMSDLTGDLRALSFSGPRAHGALRTSLATVAALLVALLLHLDNPWWAAITGVVLVQPDRTATLSRSIDRVIGTTIGAIIGYVGAATIADHGLFLLLNIVCVGFTIYAQERAQHSYAFLLGGVTVVLVLFGSLAEPGAALHLAVFRALEIYVGVIVVSVVDYALTDPTAPPLDADLQAKPGVWTWPVDRELASIAITGGIAIALIPIIWETLQLPGLNQTPITAFVILIAARQAPVWRALTRSVGCFLGGLYGLLAMHFVGDALVPWLFALFAGLFFFAEIFHGQGDAAYVGIQANIAIVVTMILGQAPTLDITPGFERLVGVFGGVTAVAICLPLISPLVRRLIDPHHSA
jgi:uncharacterized membrane protein YccC